MNAKQKTVLDAELLDRIHATVAENDRLKKENDRLRAELSLVKKDSVIEVDWSPDEDRAWRGDADSFGILDGRFE